MLRPRWTLIFLLIGGISAVFLHYFSQIRGFPDEIRLVLWPADYVWSELKADVQDIPLRPLINNVGFFAFLASIQGALTGFLLDAFVASRRAALNVKVKHLRQHKHRLDPAFRRQVLDILGKYDPAGLVKSGSGRDGYEAQRDSILGRLRKMRSSSAIQKYCRQQFRKEFGWRTVRKFSQYDSLAEDIWQAYQRQHSAERHTAPVRRGL